ncbi:MAG: hypothetical protein Q4G09_02420 [Clostridia bacterium]|nr:hypothetical protein [Clostridia bacterium]
MEPIHRLYIGGGNEGIVNGKSTINLDGENAHTHNIYGGGQSADINETNIFLIDGQATNVYGGGYTSNIIEDTTLNLEGKSNISLEGAIVTNIYGGSNTNGEVEISNINVSSGEADNVYGGNNQGGSTKNTVVTVDGGTVENVYGGGQQANIDENTNVTINGGTIENVYGGGNEGEVEQNTYLRISGGTISGSAYAGGNGVTAIVNGNTNVTVDGQPTIGNNESVSPYSGCVFGGGNAAVTGIENIHNSSSCVNIVGGNIYGNVYGGANTSQIYGTAYVNIGYEAVEDNEDLTKSNLYIKGTIFGGGESNAAGEEEYDYTYPSVTEGIFINIDATGYTVFNTTGSIFGSGNASSSGGGSTINIKNYGTIDNPQHNISIQRATEVVIDNSSIILSGTTDRTNDFEDTLYTLSIIEELKIKNNTSLYLHYGSNILQKLSSLVDINGVETKAVATINETTGATVRNVDNRIYIYQGKNVNVSTTGLSIGLGEVDGMTFLGIFTNKMNPATSTGLYNYNFQNGDLITNAGTFTSNVYVTAKCEANHQTNIDGFYSNYNNEGYIKAGYIPTTLEEDVYYIWLLGERQDVEEVEFTLKANKFVTFGTKEVPLTGHGKPNTKFIISGFSLGLSEEISLVDSDEIQAIAPDEETANTVFAFSMRTGKNGWSTNRSTSFYTEDGGTYTGATQYNSDNSNITPSLQFQLYHSQNITADNDLGTITIRVQVIEEGEELELIISYIDFIITLKAEEEQTLFYESAISPGEEFDLFSTTETNITDSGMFSMYYSLYSNDFSESEYYDDYLTYNRVLISRDSLERPYVYKRNTKFIMIDLATNQYYYYVVTQQDENSNKYQYRLSDFIKMGSTNEYFNEGIASEIYYNDNQDLIHENYIIQVDFSEAEITEDAANNILLIELQDLDEQTLISVLGRSRELSKYSIYTNQNASIDISATANKSTLYLGQDLKLNVNTVFSQSTVNGRTIYDTKYFNNQMGIKITFYDSNNNKLEIDSLLGISFSLDDTIYYPRVDGTTRINIAERVSNILSKITINTRNNSTLNTGVYTIRIESFGSPDGIYYGLESSDYTDVQVTIINGAYGLKATTIDAAKIVNKETGEILNGSNTIVSYLNYSSSLNSPLITVSLNRRDYSQTYSLNYKEVDLADYVSDILTPADIGNDEYIVSTNPSTTSTFFLTLKENLTTGTYKLVYKLYNGSVYIGETYEYIIIK